MRDKQDSVKTNRRKVYVYSVDEGICSESINNRQYCKLVLPIPGVRRYDRQA